MVFKVKNLEQLKNWEAQVGESLGSIIISCPLYKSDKLVVSIKETQTNSPLQTFGQHAK